jgi:hypothetical protein
LAVTVLNLTCYGFKKLSGTIFNVRLLHGPGGVSLIDEANTKFVRNEFECESSAQPEG